jgi:exodeoxyribonuclease VIII
MESMMAELIHNLPFADYLAIDAVSNSGLKHFARSPAHYRHAIANQKPSTPTQALGTHVHGLLLEPDAYRYAVAPTVDKRTKAGKAELSAFISASKGAHVVSEEQHALALAMRNAVFAQPYARALFGAIQPEVTAIWERDGIKRKARFDIVQNEYPVIVDLKTAAEADATGFARSAGRYRYHWQACWYAQAADACGLGERPMVFIVVESEPPHGVALYQLDRDAIDAANYRIDRLLEQFAECRERDDWPAYPLEVQPLSLPPWSL